MPEIGDMSKAKTLGYKGTHKYIWESCVDCGKERWVSLHKSKPTRFRCRSCSNKGNKNGWKSGRTINGDGYILIWISPKSEFYSMNNQNRIFEHRLVMAKYLRRCLKSWEIVHHKNHIRDDNRIENLELCETLEHQAITILERENRKLKGRIKELELIINGKFSFDGKVFGGKS